MRQKNFKTLPLSLFTFDTSPIHFALLHSGSYAHHIPLRTDIKTGFGVWHWTHIMSSKFIPS